MCIHVYIYILEKLSPIGLPGIRTWNCGPELVWNHTNPLSTPPGHIKHYLLFVDSCSLGQVVYMGGFAPVPCRDWLYGGPW